MSDIKYLKNGQEVTVERDLGDDGFLVDIHMCCFYEGETFMEPSGRLMIVDTVFDNAPVEKIQEEYGIVLAKVNESKIVFSELTMKIRVAKNELEKIERQKTDLSKLIINRGELKNAKRITVFTKDNILPVEGKPERDLKINLSFKLISGEERSWAYSFDGDHWSNGNYFDNDYGILYDLTDKEVDRITFERAASKPNGFFGDREILRTDSRYLPAELMIRKNELLEASVRSEKKLLEKKISETKKELDELNEKDESCQ